MVERDRLGQAVLEPVTRPVGWLRSRAPRWWRGRRRAWRWPRPGGHRAAGPASRPRCRCRRTPGRPTRRSIMSSGMSGEMVAEPVREKVPGRGFSQNVPGRGWSLRVVEGQGYPSCGAGSSDQAETVEGRGFAGRPQQVLGHGDDLGGGSPRESPPRQNPTELRDVTGMDRMLAAALRPHPADADRPPSRSHTSLSITSRAGSHLMRSMISPAKA